MRSLAATQGSGVLLEARAFAVRTGDRDRPTEHGRTVCRTRTDVACVRHGDLVAVARGHMHHIRRRGVVLDLLSLAVTIEVDPGLLGRPELGHDRKVAAMLADEDDVANGLGHTLLVVVAAELVEASVEIVDLHAVCTRRELSIRDRGRVLAARGLHDLVGVGRGQVHQAVRGGIGLHGRGHGHSQGLRLGLGRRRRLDGFHALFHVRELATQGLQIGPQRSRTLDGHGRGLLVETVTTQGLMGDLRTREVLGGLRENGGSNDQDGKDDVHEFSYGAGFPG